MTKPEVTIVVTQRERFSYTKPALESLYEHTVLPFKLIYVDGNAPADVKLYLEEQAQQRDFKLIRHESFLPPNQARNLALPFVDTPYVVFADNDLLVTAGWLENLIQCAVETGAWMVGPLYLEGLPEDEVIHMAAGDARFEYKNGRKIFFERHRLSRRQLASVRHKLQRSETELVEFHCALIRREVFERLGHLDEQFMSTADHIDLCLSVRDAGGTVYFEPSSVVTYVAPPPLEASDLPYFLLRWSDEWNRISLEHFRKKWNLTADDPFIAGHYKWLVRHRQLASPKSLHKMLGLNHGSWLNRTVLSPLEHKLISSDG